MAEAPLTLYLDLEPGARVDLEAAARSTLAWANLVKAVGAQIDPFQKWDIELVSATPGSQRIKSIVRLANDPETRGVIKGIVISSLLFIFKESIAWGVGEVMDLLQGPDAPSEVQALSDPDVSNLAEEIVRLLRSGVGGSEVQEVYKALERDEKIRGVGVTSSPDEQKRPEFMVDRSEFQERSLPEPEDAPPERVATEIIELTLIRPVLTGETNKRWGFQSRFGAFGAPIQDESWLNSMLSGQQNIPLAKGIIMEVEIQVTEQFEGGVWRPRERVITKVLNVTSPSAQGQLGLFQSEDNDTEDDNNPSEHN